MFNCAGLMDKNLHVHLTYLKSITHPREAGSSKLDSEDLIKI
jgi:hypothetical protein